MDLQQTIKKLLEAEYLVKSPQGYLAFTNKFYQDYQVGDVGVSIIKEVKTKKSTVAVLEQLDDLKASYMNFIMSCNIPRRSRSGNNEVYDINQYSETGKKAFGKILARVAKGEIDYELLVRTTQLYYKAPGPRQKIGNFISEGTWESAYILMEKSIADNTLKTHIKSTVDNDNRGTTRFRFAGGAVDGPRPGTNRIGKGGTELGNPNVIDKT